MARRRVKVSDVVQISLPHDGDTITPTFSVSGTGSPAGASVVGTLTDVNGGGIIQSDNNATLDSLGNWDGLTFTDAPPGIYVLAVTELDPDDGADAVNVTVGGVSLVAIASLTPTSATTLTVTVNASDATNTISGVIAGSKPVHGTPVKQKGKHQYTITFKGLTSGKTYNITVFALRNDAQGQTITFKMP